MEQAMEHHDIPEVGERLLRLKEVQHKTGLGSTTIYRLMADGVFPTPVKLGPVTVRWRESKIDAWINALPEARYGS